MASQDTQLAIASVIKIIASNNAPGAVAQLKAQAGYQSAFDIIPAAEVETLLWNLYRTNKPLFWSVLKAIPYQRDRVDSTTSPDTISKLKEIVASVGGSTQKGDWWQQLLDQLQSKDKTETTTTTTTSEPTSPAAYIAYGILAIAVIVLVIYLLKK